MLSQMTFSGKAVFAITIASILFLVLAKAFGAAGVALFTLAGFVYLASMGIRDERAARIKGHH